jgi:hypothetical protein
MTNLVEQPLHGRPFRGPARQTAIIVGGLDRSPALPLLASDERLARLALRVQRVEVVFETLFGGFPGIDAQRRTDGLARSIGGRLPRLRLRPKNNGSDQRQSDYTRNFGERAMPLSAKQHSVLQHCNLMVDAAPFVEQHSTGGHFAGRRHFHGTARTGIFGDALEQAAGGWFETAEHAFLHSVCNRVSQQIPLYPRRRCGPLNRLPARFQFSSVLLRIASAETAVSFW